MAPSAGVTVTAITTKGALDFDHTCAVSSGGGLWCWGGNEYGQLGIGSTTAQYSPVAVSLGAGGQLGCGGLGLESSDSSLAVNSDQDTPVGLKIQVY